MDSGLSLPGQLWSGFDGHSKPPSGKFLLVSAAFIPAKHLKDCNDRNPLIRALAIRIMAYIPLPAVTQALSDHFRRQHDGDICAELDVCYH